MKKWHNFIFIAAGVVLFFGKTFITNLFVSSPLDMLRSIYLGLFLSFFSLALIIFGIIGLISSKMKLWLKILLSIIIAIVVIFLFIAWILYGLSQVSW